MDRDWYERQLLHATGHTSTAECGAGGDYDHAMAHFEALAATGNQWQMRAHAGNVRWLHRQLARDFGTSALQRCRVDETYLLNALRNGFGARLPWKMERQELLSVLGSVLRSVRRSIKHETYIQDEKAEALGLWQRNGIWAQSA